MVRPGSAAHCDWTMLCIARENAAPGPNLPCPGRGAARKRCTAEPGRMWAPDQQRITSCSPDIPILVPPAALCAGSHLVRRSRGMAEFTREGLTPAGGRRSGGCAGRHYSHFFQRNSTYGPIAAQIISAIARG
jgi:hypothetical protein